MKQKPALWLVKIWYDTQTSVWWLRPFSLIYQTVIKFRRYLYRAGFLQQHFLPVPVIIVGNICVGGTGKTPLIIYLAQQLKAHGFQPGIISRGYGGNSSKEPRRVTLLSEVRQVGDEALLIARHSGCPLIVGAQRVKAAEFLLKSETCDVILSDDGLQHYALGRDIEIAVVDGARWFGNGLCLPSGPLREPSGRLDEVDVVVVNGEKKRSDHFAMTLQGQGAINLVSGVVRPLCDFAATPCHAVAGIGNPDRFFKALTASGITCTEHRFPDHHCFKASDIAFNAGPVLMTEKDAVKCLAFARDNDWYVPVAAVVEADFTDRLLNLLREKNGSETA
ncbi:MAG: tetraacyldisaccharide 4'-kinase [Gammaproteobacteria bacterium HGW-Gammaproteobacteria-3]|nr:MAG: tetraacyldisaccharide 4'-kinase [Gammaproteobacteria bacterium HGW-Gammaproteobacteria-3]